MEVLKLVKKFMGTGESSEPILSIFNNQTTLLSGNMPRKKQGLSDVFILKWDCLNKFKMVSRGK